MLAVRIEEKSFCWNESLTGVESYATQTPVSRVKVQVTTSKVRSGKTKDYRKNNSNKAAETRLKIGKQHCLEALNCSILLYFQHLLGKVFFIILCVGLSKRPFNKNNHEFGFLHLYYPFAILEYECMTNLLYLNVP